MFAKKSNNKKNLCFLVGLSHRSSRMSARNTHRSIPPYFPIRTNARRNSFSFSSFRALVSYYCYRLCATLKNLSYFYRSLGEWRKLPSAKRWVSFLFHRYVCWKTIAVYKILNTLSMALSSAPPFGGCRRIFFLFVSLFRSKDRTHESNEKHIMFTLILKLLTLVGNENYPIKKHHVQHWWPLWCIFD